MNIEESTYDFSVRVTEIVRYLKEEGLEFPLSGKLLDCGVNAGLSARKGDSKTAADYVQQADYIIEMAEKSGYLTEAQIRPIRSEIKNLLKSLLAKQVTTR